MMMVTGERSERVIQKRVELLCCWGLGSRCVRVRSSVCLVCLCVRFC